MNFAILVQSINGNKNSSGGGGVEETIIRGVDYFKNKLYHLL